MWSNPRLAPLLRNGISLRYKKRSMIEEGEDFNFYLLTSWLCAGPVLVDFRWARNLLREDFFEQLLFAIFFFLIVTFHASTTFCEVWFVLLSSLIIFGHGRVKRRKSSFLFTVCLWIEMATPELWRCHLSHKIPGTINFGMAAREQPPPPV